VDWTDYDQTDERGDRIWSNRTDAWGREDWRNITLDNGARVLTDFDQDGSHGWNRFESNFDASGRLDTSNRFFDDGSRLFVDYDSTKPGFNKLLGYDAQGSPSLLANEYHGVLIISAGRWNPAYGEGFNVVTVIESYGSHYAAPPAATPAPMFEPDPYPNAHAEVGAIEPAW
jgi:hypothetical protein